MRCVICDRNLNDFESTRKRLDGSFLDMCNKDVAILKIKTVDRTDLNQFEETPDDYFDVGVSPLVDDVSYFDED